MISVMDINNWIDTLRKWIRIPCRWTTWSAIRSSCKVLPSFTHSSKLQLTRCPRLTAKSIRSKSKSSLTADLTNLCRYVGDGFSGWGTHYSKEAVMGGMARYDAYYSSCMIKVNSTEYLTKQVRLSQIRIKSWFVLTSLRAVFNSALCPARTRGRHRLNCLTTTTSETRCRLRRSSVETLFSPYHNGINGEAQ